MSVGFAVKVEKAIDDTLDQYAAAIVFLLCTDLLKEMEMGYQRSCCGSKPNDPTQILCVNEERYMSTGQVS